MAIIDFETTGLSPEMGDRATEVAVVLLRNDKVVDRFQSLMNAGVRIPPFIESYTGITNTMIREAPPAANVMKALAEFVGAMPLVAHNASFDCKFLDAEWARINHHRQQQFACSMLLARRIYPEAPNHQLGTLVRHLRLPTAGRYHRALADAEMTGYLWVRMLSDIRREYDVSEVPHYFLRMLQTVPKAKISAYLTRSKHRLR